MSKGAQGALAVGWQAEGWRQQAAADLLKLAELHAHELRREAVVALWADCYDGLLQLTPASEPAGVALELICMGLTDIPTYLDASSLAMLAQGYADIYENGAIGRLPLESAWCGTRALATPLPRTPVEDWMARYAYSPGCGARHATDHLVSQLRFLAHLLTAHRAAAPLHDVARFVDEHLLNWLDGFADQVRRRGGLRLYQGLAALTAAYVRELREQLRHPAEVTLAEAAPADHPGRPGKGLLQHGMERQA